MSIQAIGREIPLTWETQIAFDAIFVAMNICKFHIKFHCITP